MVPGSRPSFAAKAATVSAMPAVGMPATEAMSPAPTVSSSTLPHAGALHDARQLALVAHDACDPAQAYCAPKATCVSINTAALVAYDA